MPILYVNATLGYYAVSSALVSSTMMLPMPSTMRPKGGTKVDTPWASAFRYESCDAGARGYYPKYAPLRFIIPNVNPPQYSKHLLVVYAHE